MNTYTKHEIVTGGFVVLAAAIFALFAFNILDIDLRIGSDLEPVQLTAEFTDVGALTVGDRVVFGGTEVGKVTGIAIKIDQLTREQADALNLKGSETVVRPGDNGQVIQVTFEVDDPNLRMDPATASVSISRASLLGRDQLALDPGRLPADADPIVSIGGKDMTPLAIAGQERLGFDGLLARAGPILTAAQATLDNFNDKILTDDNSNAVKSILARVDSAAEEAESFLTSAEATSDTVRGLTENVQGRIDEGWPATRAAIESLTQMAGTLEKQVELIGAEAVGLLAGADQVVRENRPEIAEATRRLRRTMFEAELLARKLRSNPSIVVFGDDDPLLDAELNDQAWLLRSGRAQPYQQRDENP
ncbi:MAG: MlaD family protein [Planctomycetota bacterium]